MKYILSLLLLGAFALVQAQEINAYGIDGELNSNQLKQGDKAFLFEANNQFGELIQLKELLKKGPVVLVFYRGYWCPICNRQLSQYQDSLSLLKAHNAQLIAVSPEGAGAIKKTADDNHLSFNLLSDKGGVIMQAYGVNFKVKNTYVKLVKSFKSVDIRDNDPTTEDAELPVPATFVINQDGEIVYRHFDPNYKNRANVADMIKALEVSNSD